MLRRIQIRYIAYFFGGVLVLLVFLNYFTINKLAIHPQQTQIIGYVLQIREIANQMKLTLTILSNLDFYNEKLADDIARLEATYSIRFSALEGGGRVEQNNQKITIPPPDEKAKVILQKIKQQWKGYSKDVALIADKLMKGKSTDTLNLDSHFITEKYTLFVEAHDQLIALYQEKLEKQYQAMHIALIALAIINFLSIGGIYYVVRNVLLIPIRIIYQSSQRLARGNLAEKIPHLVDNEIGMIAKNINDLAEILENITEFSRQIGQGNLDAEYKGDLGLLENKESIVSALEAMRRQLQLAAEKDAQAKWSSEGVAQFSELLRSLGSQNIDELCYEAIKFIVSYVQAQQGVVFILNDSRIGSEEHFLEARAAFAASKRKMLKEKVRIGETLVGQAFVDKETILLDEVPPTYEKISSALGSTLPRNVLIVPIVYQDKSLGVIEILSLQDIPSYKVHFVERLVEIMASTIEEARSYEKNQRMLAETAELEKRIARRG